MNKVQRESSGRKVKNVNHVIITDDFGNVLQIGDHVDVYVWPFDYHTKGVLQFDSEKCAFVIKSQYSDYDLSHYSNDNDGKATITMIRTFRKISEGEKHV